MASISLQQLKVVEDLLKQIRESIRHLEVWNDHLTDVNDLLSSPDGMKTESFMVFTKTVCGLRTDSSPQPKVWQVALCGNKRTTCNPMTMGAICPVEDSPE